MDSDKLNNWIQSISGLAIVVGLGLVICHVRPVNAWTRLYLALINPFRRWIVYPSLLRQYHEAWKRSPTSAI